MKKGLKIVGYTVGGFVALFIVLVVIALFTNKPTTTAQPVTTTSPAATVQPAKSAKPATPAPTATPTPKPAVTPATTLTVAPAPAQTAPAVPATPTTLGTGTFYVGKDINAGRYVVSTTNNGGNFFVYDPNGVPVVNEMLGKNTDMYVNNITTELSDGEKIEISGLNAVKFTPKA